MKILVFGSLNIDRTYTVSHFVRPGETLAALGMETFCGGKGFNQAVALSRAGCAPCFAGAIGEDGEMLCAAMKDSGIRLDFLKRVTGSSGHAIIQLNAEGQNCILTCAGANGSIDREYIDHVLGHFEKGDLIVLQNEIPNVDYIIERAHDAAMLIAFNPSPYNEAVEKCRLELVDYLLVNEVEAAALAGSDEPEKIPQLLHGKYPASNIVLTLGSKGALYIDKSGFEAVCGIYEMPVLDTTAAGDTFTGFFLAELLNSADAKTALETACIAAGISVSRKGAAPSIPYMAEVRQADKKGLKAFEKTNF